MVSFCSSVQDRATETMRMLEEESKGEAQRSNTKECVEKVDLEGDHIANGNFVMLEPTTPKMRPTRGKRFTIEQEFRTVEVTSLRD